MIRLLSSIGSIQIAILLVNLARAKFLSLVLGPAGFGVVATIDQIVIALVHLAGFGLPFTSLKFMSRSHSEGKEAFRSSYVAFLRGMGFLSAFALGVALLLLFYTPGIFGADLAPYRAYILIAVLAAPAVILNVFFVHVLASAQRTVTSAVVNLAFIATLAGGACIGVALGGIAGLYTFTVAGGAVAIVATALYLRTALGLRLNYPAAGVLQELRKSPRLLSVSLLLYMATASYSLAMLVTRYFVLSRLGEAEAGLLQSQIAIAISLGAVFGPMSLLYLTPLVNRKQPIASKLLHAHDFQVRIGLLLTIVALPPLLFPRLTIEILFSDQFTGAAAALYLFLLWQSIYQLTNVYQQVLIGLDDELFYALTTASGYVLVAVLCPFLVPRYGLGGAAGALMAGALFSGGATAVRLGTKSHGGIPARVVRSLSLCIGSILLGGMAFRGIPEGSAIGLSSRVAYSFAIMGAVWWVLPAQDQGAFRLAATRMLRKGGRSAGGDE